MRRSALLLLPVTALALAACGSDTDGRPSSSSPDPSIPRCSQVSDPGTTPGAGSRVLCVGTSGVSVLGKDGGVVRVAVTDVTRAPASALATLDIGSANDTKKDAALWFVKVRATIVTSGADLGGTDPAARVGLRAGSDSGDSYVASAPDGCDSSRFATSTVGAATASCAWTLLPKGEQPTEVRFSGELSATPTLRWDATS